MDNNLQKEKLKNFFVSVLGMIAIFAIYIISASRAPYSDNIGVLLVPPILLFLHGPLISFIYAWVQASKRIPNTELYNNFTDAIFSRMSPIFILFGVFGLIILVLSTFMCGFCGISMIFFPFWAVFA